MENENKPIIVVLCRVLFVGIIFFVHSTVVAIWYFHFYQETKIGLQRFPENNFSFGS